MPSSIAASFELISLLLPTRLLPWHTPTSRGNGRHQPNAFNRPGRFIYRSITRVRASFGLSVSGGTILVPTPIWFTPDAIADWKAQPRTTPGGQRHYSDLAIETALTLRTVFRLALRQSEGLIASIMGLLKIDLPIPDHTKLSRRARGLPICKSARIGAGELHLIVDSTGLKLRGAGEWLFEKHGTTKRRSRRKLHIGIDGDSGEIVAFDVTDKDVDDARMSRPCWIN
jgi:Transposase DDE domain